MLFPDDMIAWTLEGPSEIEEVGVELRAMKGLPVGGEIVFEDRDEGPVSVSGILLEVDGPHEDAFGIDLEVTVGTGRGVEKLGCSDYEWAMCVPGYVSVWCGDSCLEVGRVRLGDYRSDQAASSFDI